MTSSFTIASLKDYLKHLHLFGETFGLHTKTSFSVIVEIPQAIERLEQVYSFDKKCVDAVMSSSLIGTTAVKQGPQGLLPSPITHRVSPPHITMIYPSYALQRKPI